MGIRGRYLVQGLAYPGVDAQGLTGVGGQDLLVGLEQRGVRDLEGHGASEA